MTHEPSRRTTQPPMRDSVRRALAAVRAAEARSHRRRHGASPDTDAWPPPELTRRLDRLRTDLTLFVGRARAGGVSPDDLLPLVASLVREGDPRGEWPDGSDELMTKVARWSIEAYYDDPELRGAPRFF
jgi:hypothetical protein